MEKLVRKGTFECQYCDKTYCHKPSLVYHVKKVHCAEKNSHRTKAIICPDPACALSFFSRQKLRDHIQNSHHVSIELDEERFDSYEDFKNWKEGIENEAKCSYILRHSPSLLTSKDKVLYFSCHRSGHYSSQASKRRAKLIGSKKINACCPSSMDVKVSNSEVNVKFWKTHFGHEDEFGYLFLSKYRRSQIAGCQISRKQNKLERKKYLSSFQIPHDSELHEKEMKTIQTAGNEFRSNDSVCEIQFNESEIQFNENEIEKHFISKLPCRGNYPMEREQPILKKDSVPSIFPHLKKYFTKEINKLSAKCSPNPPNNKKLERNAEIYHFPEAEGTNEIKNQLTDFSFSVLSENISNVKRPNKWWGITQHENFIICVRWNANFVAERKIIFHDNLKYRVLLYETEISDMLSGDLKSLEEVSRILQTVENYVICASIVKGYKRQGCLIITGKDDETHHGSPKIWCKICSTTPNKMKVVAGPKSTDTVDNESRKKLDQRMVSLLKLNMEDLRNKLKNQEAFSNILSKLPETQKESITVVDLRSLPIAYFPTDGTPVSIYRIS